MAAVAVDSSCCLMSIMLRPASIFLIILNSILLSLAQEDLKLVHVLYRHGDRTPIADFPLDIHKGHWKDGLGQLTNEGKIQQYELGSYLRKRYGNFLNETYDRTEFSAKSTDVDRTLMSSYCNLAGLYPPKGFQVWNSTMSWQPIPVHTVPVTEDYLLSFDSDCPKYERLLTKVKDSTEAKKVDEHFKDFYAFLSNKTGKTVKSVFDVSDVYDVFYVQQCHKLSWPKWLDNDVLSNLVKGRFLDFNWSYKLEEMKKLKGGALVGQIVENCKKKIKGKLPFQKMLMYSGHDMTVMGLLNALHVYDGIFVPYAAAVLVELYEINGTHTVKIFYRNDTTQEPVQLFLNNCSKQCTFEEFRQLTASVVPVDIRKECSDSVFNDNITLICAVAGSILGCTLLMLIVLAYAFYRRNGDNYRYFNINQDSV